MSVHLYTHLDSSCSLQHTRLGCQLQTHDTQQGLQCLSDCGFLIGVRERVPVGVVWLIVSDQVGIVFSLLQAEDDIEDAGVGRA
jgi:hypothetical protein